MSRKDSYDWLDDPFDEEKQAQDMQRARMSRNLGCLMGGVAMAIIVVALAVFGCAALGTFGF